MIVFVKGRLAKFLKIMVTFSGSALRTFTAGGWDTDYPNIISATQREMYTQCFEITKN